MTVLSQADVRSPLSSSAESRGERSLDAHSVLECGAAPIRLTYPGGMGSPIIPVCTLMP